MNRGKNVLKPYHGILLLALAAIDVFGIGGYLGKWFGLYGTAMYELLLLAFALGTVMIFHGDFRKIFPMRKPEIYKVFGTLCLWLGTFLGIIMLTMIITYFFPRQMMETGAGLSGLLISVPFLITLLIVSFTPAICEEAVFRGVFFNSLWGTVRNKWEVILIVAAVFAAFHGSIWRFPSTFLLGIAMGYLLAETGNMFYNMLFHAVNNAVPIILLYAIKGMYGAAGLDSLFIESTTMVSLPLASVGVYLMYGGGFLFFIYIGNYLLHKGQPGYEKGPFPREKRNTLLVLISVGIGLVIVGIMLMLVVNCTHHYRMSMVCIE